MEKTKTKRMNFKFTPIARVSLEKLAANQGVTITDVIEQMAVKAARRRKLLDRHTA
jgi:hypothetical protein